MSPFGELLGQLARAKVRYVLVGGGAVILHGHARVTGDLDIVVEASEDNARRLLAMLATWGEGAGAQIPPEELVTPAVGALRINEDFPLDVFTLIRSRRLDRNFAYEELLADAAWVRLSNGVEVPIASIARLVDLKTGTNRTKDALDVEVLTEIERGQRARTGVDLAEMRPASTEDPSAEPGDWPPPPSPFDPGTSLGPAGR